MKYAVEMGSGVMIHILSFIKIGSGVQKLIGSTHISLYLLFQNTESKLK
jgi:hypothetical protein